MVHLPPRTPDIDWEHGFDPYWHDTKPAVTHALDAFSLLIPWGESQIIEVVRRVVREVDLTGHPGLVEEAAGLVAQEVLHSRQHHQYNRMLKMRGHTGDFERPLRWHKAAMERLHGYTHRRFSHLTRLAFISAFEHYTAVVGGYVLDHPETMAHAPEALQLIWGWHAAEEVEHKSVSFDLYTACRGGWLRRIAIFLLVSTEMLLLFARLYHMLMRQETAAGKRMTVRIDWRGLFSADGIGHRLFWSSLDYLRPGFHPSQLCSPDKAKSWLDAHRDRILMPDLPPDGIQS